MTKMTPAQLTQAVALVDGIGALKARMAPLDKELKKLQEALKAFGDGRYEGMMYDAAVFTSERSTLDQEAARAKLSPQFLAAHTKTSTVVTVKVTAKQLAVAA